MTDEEFLVIRLDASQDSQDLRQALQRLGKKFRVVYGSGTHVQTPAIETPFGFVGGMKNIQQYLQISEGESPRTAGG